MLDGQAGRFYELVACSRHSDVEAAWDKAGLLGRKSHPNEFEVKVSTPPPKPPVVLMSAQFESQTVGQVFRDAPFAPEMVVLPRGKFLMGRPID